MKDPAEANGYRLELASRVADGRPVDWTVAAASARTSEDLAFLSRLRRISEIAAGGGARVQPVRTWGPLRIIERIGGGAFGDVYRARDQRLDRDVALKLLRTTDPADDTGIIEEARMMARIRHPNVVSIFGAERIDGRTGIWMELLQPKNLAREVAEGGPLDPRTASLTALDIARALAAIHERGLLHRDVKPQNVLRDATGAAVLTDFGTGIECARPGSPAAGTPLYVAPEILEGREPSVRSDIYSLGVLLYFLLSGKHPIEAQSLDDVRAAHAAGDYVALHRRGRFPRRLRRIVDRTTDPNPARRFRSAIGVESALSAWLRPHDRRAVAALLVLGFVVAAAVLVTWRSAVPENAETSTALVRAGSIPSNTRTGGVSPDGRSVVCGNAQMRFALCDIATGERTPIPFDPARGLPDAAFAVFSPDGGRIAYMLRMQPPNPMSAVALHIMNVDGTGDRPLFTPREHEWFLRPAGWAARANLIVAQLRNRDGTQNLVLVDPGTGAMTPSVTFDATRQIETFALSDDGRYLVYDQAAASDGTRDLFVIDTTTRRSWPIVEGASDEIAPAWTPDGSRIYFSSDRAGTRGIWMQRVVDGRPLGDPEMIIDTGRDMFTPGAVLEGGRRILYLRRTGGFDGYRSTLDLTGGGMSVSRLSPRALDEIAAPDWSPDGSRIAYLASPARLGNRELTRVVVQDTATGREHDWPLRGQVHQISLRWWPDGKSLLVRRPDDAPGRSVVEIRDSETGHVIREVPLRRGAGDVVPVPDATAVLYTAGAELRELRLRDLRDRVLAKVERPWGLMAAGGLSVSRDGQRIAFSVRNGSTLAARVYVRPTGRISDPGLPNNAIPVAWGDGGHLLLAVELPSSPDGRSRLFAFDPDTKTRRDLSLQAEQPRHFRLHPDGRQILFSAGQSRLEHWWLLNADRN